MFLWFQLFLLVVQFYWIDGLFCGPIFCQKQPNDQSNENITLKTVKTALHLKRAQTKITCSKCSQIFLFVDKNLHNLRISQKFEKLFFLILTLPSGLLTICELWSNLSFPLWILFFYRQHKKKFLTSTYPSFLRSLWALAYETSPARRIKSLRSCQETLDDKFSTITRWLVRAGGPYLSTQGLRLSRPEPQQNIHFLPCKLSGS